jgi:hypothetical protein
MIAIVLGTALSPCMAQATLPLRHAVAGGAVDVGWPALSRVTVAPDFQYIGGQRFVLRGVADVEQHAFVVADSTRRVYRLLWIQIEQFLPTAPGTYDYGADSLVSLGPRALRLNVRRYSTPPDSTSDRGALYRLLRRAGYEPPSSADRVRWVQVSDDRRSEVMIIHAEAMAASRTSQPSDVAAAVARARAAFALLPPDGASTASVVTIALTHASVLSSHGAVLRDATVLIAGRALRNPYDARRAWLLPYRVAQQGLHHVRRSFYRRLRRTHQGNRARVEQHEWQTGW